MSMPLPLLRSRPLFEDKNRAFWSLQSSGMVRLFRAARPGRHRQCNMGWLFVVPTALTTATGYSLTLLMAAAYRRLFRMQADRDLDRFRSSSWSSPPAAFSSIETWAHATFYRTGPMPEGIQFWRDPARFLAARGLVGALLRHQFLPAAREQRDQLMRLEARPARRSWRCCATSSTRISCSTRSTRSPPWCC
jgi:two-component system LytT family sensor kinase